MDKFFHFFFFEGKEFLFTFASHKKTFCLTLSTTICILSGFTSNVTSLMRCPITASWNRRIECSSRWCSSWTSTISGDAQVSHLWTPPWYPYATTCAGIPTRCSPAFPLTERKQWNGVTVSNCVSFAPHLEHIVSLTTNLRPTWDIVLRILNNSHCSILISNRRLKLQLLRCVHGSQKEIRMWTLNWNAAISSTDSSTEEILISLKKSDSLTESLFYNIM